MKTRNKPKAQDRARTKPMTRSQTRLQKIQAPEKFLELWRESNRKNGGKNHFFLDKGRVVGKVAFSPINLEAERAWLLYLRSRLDPGKCIIPEPIGPVVEEKYKACLYLRVIPGQTLDQWIEENGPLNDDIASRVADAYIALREAGAPDESNDFIIPGGLPWDIMGHNFNEDNEAECEVSTRTAFNAMMAERFRVGVGPGAVFPEAKPAFTHGDISPTNILLTPDGRIAILDFGYTAWMPEYWEGFLISQDLYCNQPSGFSEPIQKAFKKRGFFMDVDDNRRIQLQIFGSWQRSRPGRQYLKHLREERRKSQIQEDASQAMQTRGGATHGDRWQDDILW